MKTTAFLILSLLFVRAAYSQTPTYEYRLMNDVQVSPTVYEFDIYLKRTGTVPLEVANTQIGLNFNGAIVNGGTLSFALVSGTSEFVAAQVPTSFFVDVPSSIFRISAKANPGAGGGTVISTSGNGTRFGRFRVTNSVSFGAVTPDLSWNFISTPPKFPTRLSAYVSGTATDITVQSSHLLNLVNPILNVSISGMKFNDTNGDGVKDAGEPGIQNWRIRLAKGGSQVDSALTASDGTYTFTNLTAGTYTVSEESRAGWLQTTSPASYSVAISGGTSSTGNNFGNFQTGSINGTKYNDINGNGVKEGGDPGLQNWRIRLTKAGVQVDSALTDASGNYGFSGLTAGTYVVSEQSQAGWIQTSTPSTYSVSIASGTSSTGNNFGNFQTGTISGTKYNDVNGNGVKDGGDAGLQNWRIRLTKSGVQVDSALTDASGNFTFSGLTAGTYTLSEQSQAGWIQISAPGSVGVTSGTSSTGNNFGNFQTGTISGTKYNDVNGNGVKDGGDAGLQNWRIRLTKAGVQVDSALTDASGNFTFSGLTAGTYTLSEQAQAGWIQISAPGSVGVTSGTSSTGNNFGNFQTGTISGAKYNDTNGNGVKEGGEPGLLNWRIRLTKAGVQVDSVLTDASGNFTFAGLTAGTYVLSEQSQAGWIQTSSPSTYSVGIASGTSSTGNNFGNFQTGTISGTKYNDTNGNGVKEGGEPGLLNWRIRLTKAGVQVDSVLTDASGNFTFSGLTAGTYVVSELSQAGWIQTSSPSTYSVGIVSGTSSAGNNFGNFQIGTISGTKYNDVNGNGVKDGGEPGLQNWRIRLVKSGVQVDSALTDASGNYSFGSLTSGSYTVGEQSQAGWIQTSSPPTYSISIVSGTSSAGNNFGNFQTGTISGTSYDDANGNGVKDGGEPGLPNWRIRLAKSGVQVDSVLTDASGNYSFGGLTVGSYSVSEQLQAGWIQTSSPATFSVSVVSGTVSANDNFGDFRTGTISGTAYNDASRDGIKDAGELGLLNWRIRLAKSGVQVDSVLTDASGNFSFGSLTAGAYTVSEQVQAGWVQTSSPASYGITVVSGTASANNTFGNFQLLRLNLTALIEGFYSQSSGTMVPDTVLVELRGVSTPFAMVDQGRAVLSTLGQGTITFPTASNGTPYYLVLKHRNAVETWSASGQTFSASLLSYDFTTAAAKAYGGNQVQKGSKWCVYSGDCAKDGWVDGLDMNLIDNNAASFLFGYYATDLNGDNWTDGLDMNVVDNNSAGFIYAKTPEAAAAPKAAGRPAGNSAASGSFGTPVYELSLANDELISPTEYEFDVYAKSGKDSLVVANAQLGLRFNSAVRNGGTLMFTMVAGSSQFSALQSPTALSVDTVNSILRVAPRPNPGLLRGTLLSNSGQGTRLGRFRITGTAPFSNVPMDLAWNFADGDAKYPSRLSAYRGSAEDITAPASHVVRLANQALGHVPYAFSLSANYPNPFNPSTTIRFTLPSASVVTLKIFNVLGQQVAAPVAGLTMAEGSHDVVFDGQSLSSGVYFYHLTAETAAGGNAARQSLTSVRKMMLVK
jgi:predicted secreted protein